MPIYKYIAKDITGRKIRSTAKAESESKLISSLSENQIFVTSVTEITTEYSRGRLSTGELALFSREVGTMLTAGVSLLRALSIIINRGNKTKLQRIYTDLYNLIKNGNSFSDSLKLLGTTFPDLYINMVVAGEATGHLDDTILRMAGFYEKEARLSAKLKNAMTYPIILFCITILVSIFIFTFVLPNFFVAFSGIELPAITKMLISLSEFFTHYWYVVLGILIIFVLLAAILMQHENFRIAFDSLKLKTPIIKKLLMTIYSGRFARTVSTLYASGLSLIGSIQIAQNTIGNRYIYAQFHDVISQIRAGIPMSMAVSAVKGFDTKLASTIQIGEETGRLTEMLNFIAETYEYESEISSQRLITILEPLMLVFMAVVIGGIMIAVMLPIFKMYQSYQGIA